MKLFTVFAVLLAMAFSVSALANDTKVFRLGVDCNGDFKRLKDNKRVYLSKKGQKNQCLYRIKKDTYGTVFPIIDREGGKELLRGHFLLKLEKPKDLGYRAQYGVINVKSLSDKPLAKSDQVIDVDAEAGMDIIFDPGDEFESFVVDREFLGIDLKKGMRSAKIVCTFRQFEENYSCSENRKSVMNKILNERQ